MQGQDKAGPTPVVLRVLVLPFRLSKAAVDAMKETLSFRALQESGCSVSRVLFSETGTRGQGQQPCCLCFRSPSSPSEGQVCDSLPFWDLLRAASLRVPGFLHGVGPRPVTRGSLGAPRVLRAERSGRQVAKHRCSLPRPRPSAQVSAMCLRRLQGPAECPHESQHVLRRPSPAKPTEASNVI